MGRPEDIVCDFDITDFDSFEDFADALEALHDGKWDLSLEVEEPSGLLDRISFHADLRVVDPKHPGVPIGDYEAYRRIGAGSFGYVFLAYDPKLEREVAIKLCKLEGDAERDRLLREAQLIARLSHHPNIVTVYELDRYKSDRDGDEFDGAPFIVMELAKGLPSETSPIRTAKRLIYKRLHWEECVTFYSGAGRGLAAAHAQGIVHGDFKPSNVLIGERGALVSDFGLAHTLGSAEEHSGGTDGYKAPELYGDGGNSPAADQFAFCVALWELIVGRLPVDEQLRPHPCPPGVMPPRLILALLRGFSPDPAERWPSMDDLLEELGQICATSTVQEPKRPRLQGGILVYTILGGVVGMLVGALLVAQAKPQQSAELLESPGGAIAERVPEQQQSDDVELAEPSDDATQASDVDLASDDAARASDDATQASEDAGQASDDGELNEASDDAEQASDDTEPHEPTECVISAGVFVDPSKELEAVCKLIRAGKLQKAGEEWGATLGVRTPDQSEDQLMYAMTETAVVIDTCQHYLTTLDQESPLAEDTRILLATMQAAYDLHRDNLNSSQ